MIDMSTSTQSLLQEGRRRHQAYLTGAAQWRLARAQIRRDERRHEPARSSERVGTLLERLGTALISAGRRLCERRGAIVVDVSFRRTHARKGCDAA